MPISIDFIHPRDDAPSYYGADIVEAWGSAPALTMVDLGTTTVAALAPKDVEVRITEESVETVDLDRSADFVALTGKVSQRGRIAALAEEARRKGRTVILGGPWASLSPDSAREHCDVLVRGEIEDIAPGLFADLASGKWKDEYVGTRPELDRSPLPRWDLYPTDRALLGSVQTSRGCPFECDFCDVIQYLGRHQRFKPISAVLAELDVLYGLGFRNVFLADDNFTVARSRAKELLEALRAWNQSLPDGKVLFSTQVSIDAAQDEELLEMCATAGLAHVFIGIETPNAESLKEAKKRQNLGRDLVAQVGRFHDHGIVVVGGMVVGFDHDGPDIFDLQLEFATAAALPVVTAGALVAPEGTPLRDRMEAEGRLVGVDFHVAATPWETNFEPARMSRVELLDGMRQLTHDLYAPSAFGDRLVALCRRLGPRRDPKYANGERVPFRVRRSAEREARRIASRVALMGPGEAVMMARVLGEVMRKPGVLDLVGPLLLHYAQARLMMDWAESRET